MLSDSCYNGGLIEGAAEEIAQLCRQTCTCSNSGRQMCNLKENSPLVRLPK